MKKNNTINMLTKCFFADIILFAMYFMGWYLTETFEMYSWVYFGTVIAGPLVFGYIIAWLLVKMSVRNVGMWRKLCDFIKEYRQSEGMGMLIFAGVCVVLLCGIYLYASFFVMLISNLFLWQALAVLFTEGFVYFFGSVAVGGREEEKTFGKYFRTAFLLNVVIYGSLICIDSIYGLF